MHFIIKSLVHSKSSEIWYKNKRTYLGGQVDRNIQRRARVRRHFVSEQGSELIQGTGPSRPGWRQLEIHPEDTTIVQTRLCIDKKEEKEIKYPRVSGFTVHGTKLTLTIADNTKGDRRSTAL